MSYTSKKPNSESDTSISLTLGEDARRDITLDTNIPIADGVYFRGVVHDGSMDGFVDRGGIDLGNRDEQVFRGQLRIEASDDVAIDLSASHSSFASNGDSRVLSELIINDGLNRGHIKAVESLLVAQGEAPFVTNDPRLVQEFGAPSFCILDDANPLTFGAACDNSVQSEMNLFSGAIEWDFSENLTFKSLTGYLDGDQQASTDFPWSGAYRRPFDIDFESFSQEFQALYQNDRWDVVVGGIYYTESGTENEVTVAASENFVPFFVPQEDILAGAVATRRDESYDSETTSFGVFAQATYAVTDSLKATAGIRYSDDEKNVDITYRPTADDPRDQRGSGSETWDNTDWRVALAYELTDDIMFYGSISEAYKAGVAIDSSLENRDNVDNVIGFVDPEEALGYEIGMRSEWLDNRFRANITAFATDYTNRQAAVLVTIDNIIFFDTVNIGDVEYTGFEGEFTFAATDNLMLTASFGLVDYEQLENPENALAYVPEESFALGVIYDRPVFGRGTMSSALNFGWTGEMFAESDQPADGSLTTQARVPSYGLLNGRIDYTPDSEKWQVGLFVNNLTDEYYWTSTSPQSFHLGGTPATGDNATTINLGRPRTFGITGSFNF